MPVSPLCSVPCPENDTPEVLKKYAAQYDATSPRWKFLTGPKDEIYRVTIKDFNLGVTDKGGTKEEPIIHDTRFVLVDANLIDSQLASLLRIGSSAKHTLRRGFSKIVKKCLRVVMTLLDS